MKEKLDKLDVDKQEVEFTLEREKHEHEKTRKVVREKEEKIEIVTGERDKALDTIEQNRDQHQSMIERFKGFTEEINKLKLSNMSLTEQNSMLTDKLSSNQ